MQALISDFITISLAYRRDLRLQRNRTRRLASILGFAVLCCLCSAAPFLHAQSRLGLMYEQGIGVARDLPQAASWFRKAADQGYADGEYNLGVAYTNGDGVVKDLPQAVSWLRKAADLGHNLAQNRLGVMYAQGMGVTQDLSRQPSGTGKQSHREMEMLNVICS